MWLRGRSVSGHGFLCPQRRPRRGSALTAEAVPAAAKKLNYHPNQCARGMRLKKAMSVATSDKDISSLRSASARGSGRACPAQLLAHLCFDRWHESARQSTSSIRANRVDGAVFIFTSISDEHHAYLTEHRIRLSSSLKSRLGSAEHSEEQPRHSHTCCSRI